MDLSTIKLGSLTEFIQFQVIFLDKSGGGMGCEELKILVHVSKNEGNGLLKVRSVFMFIFELNFQI